MKERNERKNMNQKKEVTVTIKEAPKETSDAFELAMGGWRGTIDCEKLINDIYKSRQLSAKRHAVEL